MADPAWGLRALSKRGRIDLDALYGWLKAWLPKGAAAVRKRLWGRYQRALRAVEVAEAELDLAVLKGSGRRGGPGRDCRVQRERLAGALVRQKVGLRALIGLYLAYSGKRSRRR